MIKVTKFKVIKESDRTGVWFFASDEDSHIVVSADITVRGDESFDVFAEAHETDGHISVPAHFEVPVGVVKTVPELFQTVIDRLSYNMPNRSKGTKYQ